MILSIEFGSNIKIIEGTKKKNILVISKAATLNVSADIYNSGFMDVDLTAEAIKDAFTENKISTKKAVFVIDSESVIIRKMKLPLLKKESEIITMIMLELEQQVSADLNQYRVIYKIADAFEEDGYIKALYVVYCMPLNIYNQYKRLAKTLKLLLVKLEISNCINRA
jgi:type IV pilus assembly protein PilM